MSYKRRGICPGKLQIVLVLQLNGNNAQFLQLPPCFKLPRVQRTPYIQADLHCLFLPHIQKNAGIADAIPAQTKLYI